MFSGVFASAQSRDEALSAINKIKLDTEHYIYGICTLVGAADQMTAEKEALSDLSLRVVDYCRERDFTYIMSMADLPDDSTFYISCHLYSDCIRSIAFLPKQYIEDAELSRVKAIENEDRTLKIRHLMNCLKESENIVEIKEFIKVIGQDMPVIYGAAFDDNSQKYVSKSFLAYYNSSGSILEIMTPEQDGQGRRNFKTGELTSPLYYKTAPFWIYIEGFNWNL